MYASGFLGSWLLEYIYVLLSPGPFMFDMPNFTTSIQSPSLAPSADPGVGLGGTTTPYLVHRFGSGRIPPSTSFMEDFHSLHPVFTPMFTLTGMVVDT